MGEFQLTTGFGGHRYNLGNVGLWGLAGRKDAFYKSLDGTIRLRPPGQTNTLDLTGLTWNGIRVHQAVRITPDNAVHCRYEFGEGATTSPAVSWPIHLWESALRFVGTEMGFCTDRCDMRDDRCGCTWSCAELQGGGSVDSFCVEPCFDYRDCEGSGWWCMARQFCMPPEP